MQPVRLHTLPSGAVVADFGAVYAARPRVDVRRRAPRGGPSPCGSGYLLDPDGQVSTLHGTQGTNLSFSYIMRDGAQTFEAFTYLGFRYLQIDNAGQRSRPWAGGRPGPAHRHADGAHGYLLDGQPHARRGVAPQRPLVSVLQPGAVRRHARPGRRASSSGTPPTSPRRSCAAYGDQNLTWQGLRDVARGQARYWPDGRRSTRSTPTATGARSFATFTRPLPRVALALLHGHRRPGDGGRALPVGGQGGRLVVVGPAGRHRAPLRPGRHQQRRPRLRLRPHGGGRHGEQRARRQRLQPGGPAGHRGRRRRRQRRCGSPGRPN